MKIKFTPIFLPAYLQESKTRENKEFSALFENFRAYSNERAVFDSLEEFSM